MAGLGQTALETVFPAGTDVYVALYSTEVDMVAETGTELTDANYARVAFNDWTTNVGVHDYARENNSAIVFAAFAAKESDVRWWAIWDAAVGGEEVPADGPVQIGGEPATVTVEAGNQFRFNTGELRLRVQEGV